MSKKGQQFPPRPRLKLMRERAQLSQEAAGEAIGAHRTQIAKLERGEGNLTDVRMRQLAKAYGCEPWELFEEAPLLTPEGRALLPILERGDADQLPQLLQYGLDLLKKERHPA